MLESLVPLVDQELPTLPEHLHLPPGFGEVRVAQSVVFCIVFSRALFICLSVCPLYRLLL